MSRGSNQADQRRASLDRGGLQATRPCRRCDRPSLTRGNPRSGFGLLCPEGRLRDPATPDALGPLDATNRQGFSHRDADAKSLLDEALRRRWGERRRASGGGGSGGGRSMGLDRCVGEKWLAMHSIREAASSWSENAAVKGLAIGVSD